MTTSRLSEARVFIAQSGATFTDQHINYRIIFKNMQDAQTAAKLILEAGYPCSYVGRNIPGLTVAFNPNA